jgi:hypothetical protein
LVGCSGSSSSDGGNDGGGGTDGGTQQDGGGGSCQPVEIDGVVVFSSVYTNGALHLATASFPAQPTTGVVNFLTCRPGCNFYPHPDAGVTADAGQSLDVGSLTATDVTTGVSQPFTAVNFGQGTTYETASLSWSPGDSVQAAGGGDGGFPTFTVSIQAPSVSGVQMPTGLLDGGLVAASIAAGLTVTWTPSSPPATFVAVTVDSPAGGVNCYVADSAGTLTLPSSLLSNIPQGTYGLPEGIVFGRWNTLIDSSSGKNIGVQASSYEGASLQLGP